MQGKDKRVERENGQDAGFSGVVESDKQAATFLIQGLLVIESNGRESLAN
jgi:hypothetical protein